MDLFQGKRYPENCLPKQVPSGSTWLPSYQLDGPSRIVRARPARGGFSASKGAPCAVCGDGPFLTGDLATATTNAGAPPKPVQHWLAADGWQLTPELLCPDYRTEPAS